ncbi:MAG: tetratricopeptide repeat protein [Acidobacteriota bacterium]
MSKSAFSWLHLTDLHYGLKGQGHLWPTLRQPFLDSLSDLHERCGPWDAVLFTGDLAQSGESAQFERMQAEFLDPLWKKLDELGSGDAVLLAVPGNHDLYRPNPNEDNAAIDALLEKDDFQRIEEKFWDRPAGPYRRVIGDAFAAYSQWWTGAPHRPGDVQTGILPGDFSATIERNGRRIGIVGLNTTFLQLAGGDYKGRLVWDARQLHAVCEGGVDVWSKQHDVCLLLTHQGPDWLTSEARKHGESEIEPAGRFAVHLFGHMHETDIAYIRRGGSRFAVRLSQGCSVFGMEKFGEPPTVQRAHGYAAGRIEFEEEETVLRLWPLIATDKTGRWRFIPDGEHAELEDDQGTAPETVAVRARAARTLPIRNAPIPVAPAPAIAPHSTLPARRSFFGRKKDLELIAKYLSPEDRSWGVVLDGPGGMGKTALALEAAYLAPAEHFPLKLWITAKNRELLPDGERRLTDHHVADFNEMLNELGRALGREDIPMAIPGERPSLIRHALADHRALLVLDNLETFSAEERRRTFELLDSLPGSCRAIVTSRRSAGSTAAHNIRLDKLEREAADELLAELGKRSEPVARLTQAERDRLYAETGGNPLLLTWAAGQLGRMTGRSRTVAEAVSRLQDAYQTNDPLDYVFGDLVETFTADETAVLAALVHFTEPAPVAWLLPMTGLSQTAAETALDRLRDRSLLIEDEQAGTWLLPPLAARFLRRARPEAVGASGERLADQVYALALENGYEKYDRFPTLEAAWQRISAAMPVLIVGDNRRLQVACSALDHFLSFSGRWDEHLSLSLEGEARAEQAMDFDNAGMRAFEAGWCHYQRGQSVEVLACANRAAVHWKAARTGAREQSMAIRLRGLGNESAGNYPAAIAAYREALGLSRSVSQKSENVAAGLDDLAIVLRLHGQLDEAEACSREALEMSKDIGSPSGVANSINNLVGLALDRGQWTEAARLGRETLKLAEDIGRKELVAHACRSLAKALARQGRGAEGLNYANRAVAIYSELRSPQLADAQAVLSECLA